MNDTVFTHNHPRGSSFSSADLQLSSGANVREARATSNDGSICRTFVARRPPSGWPSQKEIERSMNSWDGVVKAELRGRISRGELSYDDANRTHSHEVFRRASPELGIHYYVSERPMK